MIICTGTRKINKSKKEVEVDNLPEIPEKSSHFRTSVTRHKSLTSLQIAWNFHYNKDKLLFSHTLENDKEKRHINCSAW